MMLSDAESNNDTESTSLPADDIGGSCRHQSTEVVPLARDKLTDDPCIAECDNGDSSAHIEQENLPVVKQGTDNVRSVTAYNSESLPLLFVT